MANKSKYHHLIGVVINGKIMHSIQESLKAPYTSTISLR